MFIVIRAVLCRKTYATAKFLQLPRTDIGGHNDNRILEIDGSAIIVSQTAFIQYLEQDVEHVRMGFLNLIQQDNGIRLATNLFGQLAAFLIAHISRSGTNHTRYGVFLHILAHIDTYQGIGRAKHIFCQLLCQMRLTHTSRAKEHKGSDGMVRVFQPYTATQDCFGKFLYRSILSYHLRL